MVSNKLTTGVSLSIFGIILIYCSLRVSIYDLPIPICYIVGFMGVILFFVGVVYVLSFYYKLTPQGTEFVLTKKAGRYCPKCGHTISYDMHVCPYCEKRFD